MYSSKDDSIDGARVGLRPRLPPARPNGRTINASNKGDAGMGMNPLDRLSEALLDWNILRAAQLSSVRRSVDEEYERSRQNGLSTLPDIYHNYEEYIAAWEPVMITDVKAGIISKFSSLVAGAPCGSAVCTAGSSRSDESTKMALTCSFSYDSSANKSRQAQCLPAVMDLILISLDPLDLSVYTTTRNNSNSSGGTAPITTSTATQNNFSILGIVVNSTTERTGARSSQVNVLATAWENLRQGCKDRHVSTFTPAARQQLSNGSKSYKLHYTVIDSLRSTWREFQALHDVGQNVPLLSEILGADRTFTMAATPPYAADDDTPTVPVPESPVITTQSSQDATFSDTYPSGGQGTPRFPSDSQAGALAVQTPTVRLQRAESIGSVQRQQARVATVEALVHSWKMKGCTDKFMRYLRLKYNPSQLHAIHTAAEQEGFTLVQGPPGTGKTSTILGILNAIHIREYNQYYKMALDALLGPEGQRCRMQPYEAAWINLIARLTAAKPRILVVAPSNTAVDNIILRIMEDGFVDGNGGQYFPNILRVGSGSKSAKVKSVTLEDLIEREVAQTEHGADRLEVVEELNGQITNMIKELAFVQSMLVNLTTAYAQCNPLPKDFELRVDNKTGLPYWADHQLRTTTTSVPPARFLKERGQSTQFTAIESLPDYILYSHRLTQLVTALDAASSKRKKVSNMTDVKGAVNLREAAERLVIDSAQVLLTTLNSAGHPSMESTEFCVTVVDEAAQSTEPSVLIALRRGCKQCVMVGDQQQLTATVFSSEARAALYDRSLFQRLIEIGHPYIMLDTQYRMHPAISAFPCRVFYGGHLKDGANVMAQDYLPSFLTTNTSESVQIGGRSTPVPLATLCPFMFLDLDMSREKAGATGSQSNSEEAVFVSTLLGSLQQAAQRAGCKTLGSIGVITFYSDQLAELRRVVRVDRLNSRFPAQQACKVDDLELNTVDGFQGKEKDIIIISAVRANDHGGVGFISDLRRMNVALTRARKGLFVVGHAPTLSRDATWRALLDHAVNSGAFLSVPNAYSDVLDLLQRRAEQHQRQLRQQQQLAMQHAVTLSASAVPIGTGDCGPTPSEPGPPASEGKIVVSSETVGWVSDGAAAGNPLRHSATTTQCKDRDYALADQLTTTRMKRKFQATEAEEGEIEE